MPKIERKRVPWTRAEVAAQNPDAEILDDEPRHVTVDSEREIWVGRMKVEGECYDPATDVFSVLPVGTTVPIYVPVRWK